jgi:hypothetical protein
LCPPHQDKAIRREKPSEKADLVLLFPCCFRGSVSAMMIVAGGAENLVAGRLRANA